MRKELDDIWVPDRQGSELCSPYDFAFGTFQTVSPGGSHEAKRVAVSRKDHRIANMASLRIEPKFLASRHIPQLHAGPAGRRDPFAVRRKSQIVDPIYRPHPDAAKSSDRPRR